MLARQAIWKRKWALISLALWSGLLPTSSNAFADEAHGQTPGIYLWAWERRDDLRSLPPDVGVAYLAATIRVLGKRIVAVPRRQPLFVPPATTLISVFRIEIPLRGQPKLDDNSVRQICNIILRWNNYPHASSVQIDFDARQNQRDFYRRVLRRLRATLPERCPIAITALASWCLCDNWMKGLPVTEGIPMLFSMGPDNSNVLADIASAGKFSDALCQNSIGLSIDEPQVNDSVLRALRNRSAKERIYIFSSKQWSAELVQRAIILAQSAR